MHPPSIAPPLLAGRLSAVGAVLLLALPLVWGWHPTPTLGTLAEAVAVFCVAALLAISPSPTAVDWRRLGLGSAGLLGLLLLRCLGQALGGDSAYAGFWFGPLAVLGTAFLVSVYWQQSAADGLKVVAAAVLLAATINALVGLLQYWRLAVVFDFLGPYLVYWDRTDNVAHGNVAQRNILASLCLLGLAASVYLFPRRRAPVIAVEGFLAYVVALSASRTPLVIVLAVVLLTLFRGRHWRALAQPAVRWFVVPVLLAQLLAPVVNQALFALLEMTPVEASVERLSAHGLGIRPIYYQLAAEIGWQSGGIWGLGWKSLPVAMVAQGYGQNLWGASELPTHAHNVLLQLWVENGPLIALLASLYPIWLLFRRGFPSSRQDYARLSLLVLIVHSWLEYPLWQPALLFLFVVLMGTLESDDPAPDQAARQTAPPSRFRGGLGLRALAVAVALGAGVTVLQFVAVAAIWKQIPSQPAELADTGLNSLRLNPVIEPYADWLALNMNTDTAAQRVLRLERLAQWLPDAMMLELLADAYRAAGRLNDAQKIDSQRRVVFGVASAPQDEVNN